ncbi:MAG: cobalamin biosynthesis protein P47K [Firmicutes bacterium]|nr:cobalamin biosynthesis protein P47K [Acetobacterium woodii]MBU4440449.1 cobalamin biosynthesis protein P47K [Bacillota bacterium]
MKVIILGGFLGSGKTSVVIQLARHVIGADSENRTKVVILENEIGEVSIDDKILQNSGYEVANLFSGCVCCTMAGELVLGLHKIIEDFNPELIIMEATGVAYPENIRKTINHSLPDLDCSITCVTDAKRWLRLLRPMEMLLEGQLDAAEVILINKVDLVDEDSLSKVEDSIRTFNSNAQFFNISATQRIDPIVFEAILGAK